MITGSKGRDRHALAAHLGHPVLEWGDVCGPGFHKKFTDANKVPKRKLAYTRLLTNKHGAVSGPITRDQNKDLISFHRLLRSNTTAQTTPTPNMPSKDSSTRDIARHGAKKPRAVNGDQEPVTQYTSDWFRLAAVTNDRALPFV